jgi:long-chain acyl-CoA synthetase
MWQHRRNSYLTPNLNLAHLIARAARVFPERLAVADGERAWLDYRGLAARAARIAQWMRETLGLGTGDRVALYMTNCPAYLEVLGATWWAGCAAVPVNAKLHPQELAYILQDSEARALFVTPDLAHAAASVAASAVVIDVSSERYAALYASDREAALADVAPTDLAWLFYTSGTTGRPKGVMLSHRNLYAMTLAYFADVDTIAPGDSIVHAAPMSHGSGLYALPHLAAAATQVIPASGGFDAAEVFDLAHRYRGVAMFAAPTIVKRLVDHARRAAPPLEGLKTIVYGGAPMYEADIRDALTVMGPRFAQIYGQGESPMTITALSKHHLADRDHPRYAARLASVGVAQTGVEVRILDAADRPAAAGTPGEVCARGDVVMSGYWRNPEASAKALAGGWLHTGDVGALDADGFLTLMDRSKDLIISGGSNIYPREIEEVLLKHPAVHECAVVGRRHPEWGEEVVAFVVLRTPNGASAADLDALCLAHIARFKRPKDYRFVAGLPKNNYGKVLKTALRDAL